MKKNIIAAAFVTTAALSMSNVFAAAGTVNFNGEIPTQHAPLMWVVKTRPLSSAVIKNLNSQRRAT